VCLLATVNRAFGGASYADFVWEPKLPLNYEDVLGRVFKEEEEFVRESSFTKENNTYSSFDAAGTKV
ncbi:f-box family protein, partial [Genlisea aurea]